MHLLMELAMHLLSEFRPNEVNTMKPMNLSDFAHKVHELVIEATGGASGVRYDADLFYAKDLLDLAKRVVTAHPFTDGNKRTGYVIWKIWQTPKVLNKDGYQINIEKVMEIIKEDIEWLKILARI